MKSPVSAAVVTAYILFHMRYFAKEVNTGALQRA
jgi:hypothetical protein